VLAGVLTVLDTIPAFPRLEFVAAYPRGGANPLVAAVAVLAAEISEFPRGIGKEGAPAAALSEFDIAAISLPPS
jgi:hypothetical protein